MTALPSRAPRARTVQRSRIRNSSLPSSTFRVLVLLAAGVYFAIPLYWLAITGSKSAADLSSTAALAPGVPHLLQNVQALVAYDGAVYLRWMANSALYSIVGAGAGTVIAGMAGYYLAKFSFRGNRFLFNVVLGAVLIPTTALSLPLFLLFAQVHVTNTVWAVLIPSMISPFALYLSRIAADAAVPSEIIEAARIDGAGEVRIFFTVAARLMSPALVTVFLLQFVGIWNNFLLPLLMLQDEHLYPVTLGLYLWNGQVLQQPDLRTLVFTGSLLSVAPLIVCFVALQRFWRSGLTTGGLKS